MTRNMTALTSTVSLDLTYFSSKFIECGFVTDSAVHAVLTKLGISDGDKASQLLHLITENYKISLKKRVWAEKFIAVFSSQAAYADLATTLSRDMLPGISIASFQPVYISMGTIILSLDLTDMNCDHDNSADQRRNV